LIEINLAPGAQIGRSTGSRRASIAMPSLPQFGGDSRMLGLAALGIFAVLAVGWLIFAQGSRRADLEARVASEAADSSRYAATIALVSDLQARQDTIRQQIAVIRDVDQRRFVWPRLMDEVSRALPPFTWLTQITSTPVAAATGDAAADSVALAVVGPAFTIQGNAGSTQALTRFMKNLEDSHFIRDVTLVTSEQVDADGRTIHRFTLEARYETPPSSVIETVPFVVVE
jgi:Tfp pilus assembly protein PilN